MLRLDCTDDPAALLEGLLRAHHDPLVVVKAFQAAGRKEKELAEKFADCHKFDNWYVLRPKLKRFLESEALCETLLLKRNCSFEHRRLRWSPAEPNKQQMLIEACMDNELPGFVKNAERFILWAIDDLAQSGEVCYPGLLIKHPANRFYKPKTIYNSINLLAEEGRIVKTESRRLELSDAAQEEIDGLKRVWELKQNKRRKSLRV